MRRVVTGEVDGKSVVVSDDEIEPEHAFASGSRLRDLWGMDHLPVLPIDGTKPGYTLGKTPPGSIRFVTSTFQGVNDSQGGDAVGSKTKDARDLDFEFEKGGHHATDTIDFCIILSGEIYLELDDGTEVLLRAGDTLVQNGTRHAWRNRSPEPCTFAIVGIAVARDHGKGVGDAGH